MLILSRKIGEEIVLPEHGVTIGVMAIGDTRVRLGISAPLDVVVHRREVFERVRRAAAPASNANANCADGAIEAKEPL